MNDRVRRLLSQARRQKGQSLVEYALLAGLIALAAFVSLGGIGINLLTFFDNLAKKLTEFITG